MAKMLCHFLVFHYLVVKGAHSWQEEQLGIQDYLLIYVLLEFFFKEEPVMVTELEVAAEAAVIMAAEAVCFAAAEVEVVLQLLDQLR